MKTKWITVLLVLFLGANCTRERELAFVQVKTSGNMGLVVGPESFRTRDAGRTWTPVEVPFTTDDDYHPWARTLDHSLLLPDRLYAVSYRQLWESKDGGATWNLLSETDKSGYFGDIFFFERGRALIQKMLDTARGGRQLFLYVSGEETDEWRPIEDLPGMYDAVSDEDQVIFLDTRFHLRRSTDKGETWEILAETDRDARSLALGVGELWVVGIHGYCRRLSIESRRWKSCGIDTPLQILDVAVRPPTVVAGSLGVLFVSTDNGQSWAEELVPYKYDLVSVGFFADGTAIAVGGHQKEMFFGDAGRIVVLSRDLKRWERLRLGAEE